MNSRTGNAMLVNDYHTLHNGYKLAPMVLNPVHVTNRTTTRWLSHVRELER